MKKLLFIISNLQLGGAETVLVDMLNNMCEKFEIDLLLINKYGAKLDNLNSKINLKYLTKDESLCKNFISKFYNKAYRSLIYRYLSHKKWFSKFIHKYKLKKKYNYEVGFLLSVPVEFILNSPDKKSKKIMWIHSKISESTEKTKIELPIFLKKIDRVVCCSVSCYKDFILTYPMYKNKTIPLTNYIDTNRIKAMANMKQIEFNKNKINVVSIGRLSEVKGFERILSFANDFEKVCFHIIGNGELYEKYTNIISEKNINNVKLLGLKTNPYPYLKSADIFLLSSYSEAYSTVAVEALILHKAIVSTEVCGIKEIVGNYKKAIICKNDTNELRNALKKAIEIELWKVDCKEDYNERNKNNLKKVVDLFNEKEI